MISAETGVGTRGSFEASRLMRELYVATGSPFGKAAGPAPWTRKIPVLRVDQVRWNGQPARGSTDPEWRRPHWRPEPRQE